MAKAPIVNCQSRKMFWAWQWIGRFSNRGGRSTLLPFESITDKEIQMETGIDVRQVYRNELYWMPRFYQ